MNVFLTHVHHLELNVVSIWTMLTNANVMKDSVVNFVKQTSMNVRHHLVLMEELVSIKSIVIDVIVRLDGMDLDVKKMLECVIHHLVIIMLDVLIYFRFDFSIVK